MIFCSPHNPTGRAWERWEIETAMELFKKYDVYVISDEIWSDLYLADHYHIPTQSVSEDAKNRTIAFYAPSKTFNLAGLIGSYHIVYNKRLRDRLRKEASLCHYNSMNVLSMYALMGAYTPEGEEWLGELKEVLTNNINYACDFFATRFKGVKISKPQATYMLFLDCEGWCKEHGKTLDELQQAGGFRGRALAGWPGVSREVCHPHESGAAVCESKRGVASERESTPCFFYGKMKR